MKFLIADTYYPAFLRDFYAVRPELAAQPYAAQWRALMDECFGTAGFYSTHLRELGHEAEEVVPNCEPMQRQWARENGVTLDETRRPTLIFRRKVVPWLRRAPRDDWFFTILEAQVQAQRPDVLYVQDMHALPPFFLQAVRPYVQRIVGQIASPTHPGADFRDYDLILTSFPHFVPRFRAEGRKSEYFRIGFEPKVLTRLTRTEPVDVAFVGGLSSAHSQRVRFLETMAQAHLVDFWGYGADCLSQSSPLRRRLHGDAWGLAMYQALYNAKISLNLHIDAAGSNANNMRLYESTGVGALLLTDAKDNLHTLFEPGREVAAYRSPEECAEMIGHYLSHEDERAEIAAAGQARTLREHTYAHRMRELLDILSEQLGIT